MGKSENNEYFGNYCNLTHESWQKQTTNEGMHLIKVYVISCPGPKVIEISKLKTLFFSVTSQPMNVKFYLKPSCIRRKKFYL